ncbi:ATP-dependent endonuclease [Promethearchaeum syntrophicum]|uniref:ATP-dependent endonuclease n=1 Tax=Promethearchaeum syntrophicum TaxID=2594042 RepID=A0A5B9D8U3_9ARCH|nr:AAA family ATPase [Candidatus Prometheoarchaeum syntrophicum]QEE15277.1 DNA replication and repair protein RecF [Candidatus Prometheoarchaeum syntrophicum]
MSFILKKIKIENYRCFKEFEFDLCEFNTIVGKNATGKSSLLYAINEINNEKLSKETIYNDYKENEIQRISFFFSGIIENSSIKIRDPILILTDEGYKITYFELFLKISEVKMISPKENFRYNGTNESLKQVKLQNLLEIKNKKEFIFQSKDWNPIHEVKSKFNFILKNWTLPSLIFFIDSKAILQTHDFSKIESSSNFKEILIDLARPKVIFFSENILNQNINSSYNFLSFNENFNFTLKLLKLGEIDREKFQKLSESAKENMIENIEAKFNEIFLNQPYPVSMIQFSFQFIKDNFSFKPRLKNGKKIEFENLSAGLRWLYTFILVFFDPLIHDDIIEKFDHRIILIDEPGKNIHPEAQMEVLEYLKLMNKNNQIIYSTHMPFLIDYSNPNSVQCISYVQNTQKHEISNGKASDLKIRIADAIGLPKERFLTFPEKILLVEGPSDRVFIERINEYFHEINNKLAQSSEIEIWFYHGLSEINHLCKLFDSWKRRNFLLLYDDDTDLFSKGKVKDPKDEPEVQKFRRNIVKLTHPAIKKNIAIEDFIPRTLFNSTLKKWLKSYGYEKDFLKDVQNDIKDPQVNQSQIISRLEKEEQLSKLEFIKLIFETENQKLFTENLKIVYLFQLITEKFRKI